MKEILLVLGLIHGADAATACEGFRLAARQTTYTVRDRHPLIRGCRSAVAVKAATAGLSAGALHDLRRRGHPKLARILTYVSVAPAGVGVVLNVRAIHVVRSRSLP